MARNAQRPKTNIMLVLGRLQPFSLGLIFYESLYALFARAICGVMSLRKILPFLVRGNSRAR